ncbi:RsiV family protein [Chryseobacterium salviniae]|uniref:RsiV family protein n=1 Tax=Chryseobacterium salviniae TaxID=3101750 RepID=A0ABU6HY19_9FLAO|nr:RsiV family protein [Chryseobacterium sp. T9W2-O]MEC3877728.1 RsiV family protein [Chryseobacterium sp. T9W2-O]
MKNSIAALAISGLIIISCKKTENIGKDIVTNDSVQINTFSVDSVKINDSLKLSDSLTVTYSSTMLVFPDIKDKTLLDSIYFGQKNISDFSKNGILAWLEKDKNDYFSNIKKDSKDWIADMNFSQKWYTDTGMKLKSKLNDYMRIQYIWGSYEGGAHDNYGFSERVFDIKNNKKLQLKDITSMPTSKIEAMLLKNINKINSGTTDNNGAVNNSEMLLVDKIPATENFYFDEKNLYFHYSPYEIAAFAAGDITIPVSWEELKGSLNPEFEKRMKISY